VRANEIDKALDLESLGIAVLEDTSQQAARITGKHYPNGDSEQPQPDKDRRRVRQAQDASGDAESHEDRRYDAANGQRVHLSCLLSIKPTPHLRQ
jgi:hypothetical protein